MAHLYGPASRHRNIHTDRYTQRHTSRRTLPQQNRYPANWSQTNCSLSLTNSLKCGVQPHACNGKSKTRLAREIKRSNLTQAISHDKFQPCHWPVLAYVAFLAIKPRVACVKLETELYLLTNSITTRKNGRRNSRNFVAHYRRSHDHTCGHPHHGYVST